MSRVVAVVVLHEFLKLLRKKMFCLPGDKLYMLFCLVVKIMGDY